MGKGALKGYFFEGEGFGEGLDLAFEVLFGLGEGEALAFEPFLAVGEGDALAFELFLAVGEGDGLAIGASFCAVASAADNFTHCGSSLLPGCEQNSFANSTLLAISSACASACMAAFSARAFSTAASIQL